MKLIIEIYNTEWCDISAQFGASADNYSLSSWDSTIDNLMPNIVGQAEEYTEILNSDDCAFATEKYIENYSNIAEMKDALLTDRAEVISIYSTVLYKMRANQCTHFTITYE